MSKAEKARKGRGQFSTLSLPTPLIKEVETIVETFKYWPRKTDFVREAVVEKLETYKRELEERRRTDDAEVAET